MGIALNNYGTELIVYYMKLKNHCGFSISAELSYVDSLRDAFITLGFHRIPAKHMSSKAAVFPIFTFGREHKTFRFSGRRHHNAMKVESHSG
jgi:hypothetical protein